MYLSYGTVKDKTADYIHAVNEKIQDPTAQRRLTLIIVCTALLLDNMLYMVIVPIIPNYLREINAFGDDVGPSWRYVNATNHTEITVAVRSYNMSLKHHGGHVNKTKWKSHRLKLPIPPPPIDWGTNENAAVGVLFASKAIIQLMVNPFTGALIDRIGYDYPMMIGLMIMFLSTAVFAFGESYAILFLARSLQGLGSAFADTSGLAMIADRYREEAERTKALGIALAFISFGCLFAPPFGGIMYEFAGKEFPFLILALICLVDGILLLFVMKPVRKERSLIAPEDRLKGTPIWRLLMDPYILVTSGALAMSNVSLAFLEPTIAMWMNDSMDADEWEIGFVWLPAFIPHICGVILTVKLARTYPKYQWLLAAVGLTIEGVSCFMIPFAKAFFVVLFPIMGICFGIALVDTALIPTLGYLVDVRYVSVYGSVYAIADISYSFAYAFGPIVAGTIVQNIGFLWLNVAIMISNVLYAPLLLFLRKIYEYSPFREEDCEILVNDPPEKHYMTHVQNGWVPGGKSMNADMNIKNHLEINKNWPDTSQYTKASEEIDYCETKDSDTYQFYNRR